MGDNSVTLTLTADLPPELDGRTFQLHARPGGRVCLYPVELPPADTRCPVLVGGERCGRKAGHDGKHCWANGD